MRDAPGWACTNVRAFVPTVVAVLAALAWLPWVVPALRFVGRSRSDSTFFVGTESGREGPSVLRPTENDGESRRIR